MKIRNGFVSNSSSSSFLIYGTAIEESDGDFERGERSVVDFLKEIRSRDAETYDKYVKSYVSSLEENDRDDGYWKSKRELYSLLLKLDDLTEEEVEKVNVEIYDVYYTIGNKLFGMSINHTPWDETYVGLSWSDVGDDETGAQFKERARKLVALVFGKTHKLETCEHAWRDG